MWEFGKLLINQFVRFMMQIFHSITRQITMKLFVDFMKIDSKINKMI